MKKGWVLLLIALALMLTCAATAFAEPESATPLALDTPVTATIATAGGSAWFSFTPEETADYDLFFTTPHGVECTFYDADMEDLEFGGEEDYRNGVFHSVYGGPLEAGNTYYMEVMHSWSSTTGDIGVTLVRNNHLVVEQIGSDELTLTPSETRTLEVSASCDRGELHYQWACSYTDPATDDYIAEVIEGATASTLEIGGLTHDIDITYTCKVSDDYGYSESAYFYIQIDSGLTIGNLIDNTVAVPYGEMATLEALASVDFGELSYSWYDESIDDYVEGANGPTLTTGPVVRKYSCTCTVKDEYGHTRDIHFLITVDSGLHAEPVGPQLAAKAPDEPLTLAVQADCDLGNITYSWEYQYLDSETEDYIQSWDFDEVTTPNLVIPATAVDGDAKCYVRDDYDNTIEIRFKFRTDNGLTAAAEGSPLKQLSMGQRATLVVNASALKGGLTYEWYDLNTGLPIDGEEGPTFTTPELTEDTMYRCYIDDEYSNDAGVTFLCTVSENVMTLGETRTLVIAPNETRYVSFTPDADGGYALTVTGGKVLISCQDAGFNWIGNNGDGEEYHDRSLNVPLEAGQKYYFRIHPNDAEETCEYSLTLSKGYQPVADDGPRLSLLYLRVGQTVILPDHDRYNEDTGIHAIRISDPTVLSASGDHITALSPGSCDMVVYLGGDWGEIYNYTEMAYVVTVIDDASVIAPPEDLREIQSEAFAGDASVQFVALGANVERIGAGAFEGTNLKQLLINGYGTRLTASALRGVKPTIICHKGSWAESYAYDHSLDIVYID